MLSVYYVENYIFDKSARDARFGFAFEFKLPDFAERHATYKTRAWTEHDLSIARTVPVLSESCVLIGIDIMKF